MCPVKARRIRINRINPSPPLGQYPQPELYGHAGSAPIKRRIRIINSIVPMASPFLNCVRRREGFWTLRQGENEARRLWRDGVQGAGAVLLTALDFPYFGTAPNFYVGVPTKTLASARWIKWRLAKVNRSCFCSDKVSITPSVRRSQQSDRVTIPF
jgi:hypothetical protein